jgi:hypothetical protein
VRTLVSAALAAVLMVAPGCAGGREPAPERAARPRPALEPGVKNVGILVFDELFITEFVAPFDV